MADFETLTVRIQALTSGFSRGIADAERKAEGFGAKMDAVGSRMRSIGRGMSTYVTLPIIGAGVAAVKFAADFEQSLRNAVSVTGLTGKAADEAEAKMRKLALQLGADTAYSAKEAADAMYDLASSGWDARKMAKGLPGIMDLAAATQSDLAATTETVTATLGQFGLKAGESGRVADVFTTAIGSSKANMDRLSDSMKYVGPIANSLGLSLEDTTAILSKLYDAGFDGSTAGTALRAAFAQLQNPIGQAKQALQDFGISQDQINPATHSLSDVLQTLAGSADKGAERTKLFSQVFGREAAPAMLSLVDNAGKGSDSIAKLTTKLEHSGGAAKRVAETQLDTFSGQLEQLGGSVETAAIKIGEKLTPALRAIVESLIPVVNSFSSLPAPVLGVVIAVAALAAAIGPVVWLLGSFLAAAAAVGAALAGVGGVIAGGIGLAALAGGLALAGTKGDSLQEKIGNLAESLRGRFRSAVAGAKDFLHGLFDTGPKEEEPKPLAATADFGLGGNAAGEQVSAWQEAGARIREIVGGLWGRLREAFSSIRESVSTVADSLIRYLTPAFDNFRRGIESLQPALGPVGALLKGVFLGALAAILPVVKIVAMILGGVLIAAITGASLAFRGIAAVIGAVGRVLQPFEPQIETIGKVIGYVLGTLLLGAVGKAIQVVGKLAEAIPLLGRVAAPALRALGAGVKFAGEVFGRLVGAIGSTLGKLPGLIGGILARIPIVRFFMGIYNTLVGHSIIPDLVHKIVALIGSLPKAIGNALGSLVSSVVSRFNNMRRGAVDRVVALAKSVAEKFASMREGAADKLGALVSNTIARFTNLRKGVADRISALVSGAMERWNNLRRSVAERTGQLVSNALDRFTALRRGVADRIKQLVDNARDRFTDMRRSVIERVQQLRDKVVSLATNLRENLGERFAAILENAKNRWTDVREAVTNRVDDMADKVRSRIDALREGIHNVFEKVVGGAKSFGDAFKGAVVSRIQSTVNTARKWLGGFALAIASILDKIGAGGAAGTMRKAGNNLQNPLKFARGGVYNADEGGTYGPGRMGIVGEAGDDEAVINLRRKTPESQEAFREAAKSPNASPMDVPPLSGGRPIAAQTAPGGTSSSWPPKAPQYRATGGDQVVNYSATPRAADAARAGAAMWRGLVRAGGHDATIGRSPYKLQGAHAQTYTDGRTILGPEADKFVAAHEMGHLLGLGHGGNGIMGGMGRTIGGPSQGDFDAIAAYYGGRHINAPYGGSGSQYKGRTDDGGGGAGIYGPTDNSLWDAETFGRVLEILKRFRVSADTYRNHPPGYPGLAGKSADFWDYAGRGTPINKGLGTQVKDYILNNLNAGRGWTIWNGTIYRAGDAPRPWPSDPHYDHVHTTWTGPDPSVPNVPYHPVGGGGGGFDWMGAITSGLAAIAPFPKLPGILGEGLASVAPMLIGKAKDWLIEKAQSIWGSVSGAIGGAYNRITGLTILEAAQKGGFAGEAARHAGAIIWRESRGQADAQNPSGARGLMQIMPQTAAGIGVDYGRLYDPIYNTTAGHKLYMQSGWSPWNASNAAGLDYSHLNDKVTGYARGGVIPGPKGLRVLVEGHAGERVLPIGVVDAFDRLAASVHMWRSSEAARGARTPFSADDGHDRCMERVERLLNDQLERMPGEEGLTRSFVAGAIASHISPAAGQVLDHRLQGSVERILELVGGR